MAKGIPVILFGAGATFFWLSILVAIEIGAEGYPSEFSPQTWINDLQEIDSFLSDDSSTFVLMIFFSLFGAFVGLFVMFLGSLILTTEISTRQKINEIKRKKVSIVWQVIFSFVPGLDLWVIYRIEKLRLGGIIYSVNFASGLIGVFFMTQDFDTSSLISIIVSIIFAFFVYRWSKEWNAKYGKDIAKPD